MAEQQPQQQQTTTAPRHVPLSEITHQGLVRALGAESDALQKIHVRIQRQLQNLEMEEKLLKHMIQRERNAHTAAELQQFDAEMQQQQHDKQPQPQQETQQDQADHHQQPAMQGHATSQQQNLGREQVQQQQEQAELE